MSTQTKPEEILVNPALVDDWKPSPPPTDLIFDDGEPMETYRHRIAMNTLIDSVYQAFADREDFFAGGNMFIYYSSQQVRNKDFKGPDFFVVLDVDGNTSRQGWVVWEEGGRYPDVIIELMSPSTKANDLGTKKDIYERIFKTSDYFVYNPFNANSLRGWHLGESRQYEELTPNERGWLWCQTLGMWLGTWEGIINRDAASWLRFYDTDGNLVLLPKEAEFQRAEAEKHRAETESQRAEAEFQRAETEKQRAETESQRAEAESQRAEAEKHRAEAASQLAETEKQRAEAASQLAERLAARLRELGENPDVTLI